MHTHTLRAGATGLLYPIRRGARTLAALVIMLVSATLALTSCAAPSGGEGPPTGDPAIRGEITQVRSGTGANAGRPTGLLIEENPAEDAGSDKAWIDITPETRILAREGTGWRTAGGGELVTGRIASAWFTGPVRESYPVQAVGSAVVIEVPAP